MAKFCGVIGYSETIEIQPGIWEERSSERMYYGDILQNTRNYQSSDDVIDDVNISNRISIIADPFATQNTHSMKYVKFMGAKWKITRFEIQHPRLILTVGGVYNG